MAVTESSETGSSRRLAFRAWTFALLEEGELSSKVSKAMEAVLIFLIIANVAAVALETIPPIYGRWGREFSIFEKFSIGAYTIEYLLRVWCSVEDPRVAARGPVRGRISFLLRPLMIIDFLAFAPGYLSFVLPIDLRVLRIFRLFRLVKLARYSQALPALLGVLYAERSALFASAILLVSTMFVSGEVMHIVEGAAQPAVLGTLPDAMYWAITTLTTVGYGDVTPHTALGKLVAGITMVLGLGLFALPIGIIANGFISGLDRRRFAITWSILKKQPLLDGLRVEALTDILECARADIVPAQGQLTVAGEAATALFLIVSGEAREERDQAIRVLLSGDFVGLQAFRQAATYARTVTARSEVRVICLSHDDLKRLGRKYRLLRRRLEKALSRDEAGLATQAPDPEQRINHLEKENAALRRALSDIAMGRIALAAKTAVKEPAK